MLTETERSPRLRALEEEQRRLREAHPPQIEEPGTKKKDQPLQVISSLEFKRLRKYLTTDLVLRVHARKTPEDREALKLLQEEFDEHNVKIIAHAFRDRHMPILYAATSIIEGLPAIKTWLTYIQTLPKPDVEQLETKIERVRVIEALRPTQELIRRVRKQKLGSR